jgi:hypothetical protein
MTESPANLVVMKKAQNLWVNDILCLEIRDTDGLTSKPGCDDNSLYALYKIDRY